MWICVLISAMADSSKPPQSAARAFFVNLFSGTCAGVGICLVGHPFGVCCPCPSKPRACVAVVSGLMTLLCGAISGLHRHDQGAVADTIHSKPCVQWYGGCNKEDDCCGGLGRPVQGCGIAVGWFATQSPSFLLSVHNCNHHSMLFA